MNIILTCHKTGLLVANTYIFFTCRPQCHL